MLFDSETLDKFYKAMDKLKENNKAKEKEKAKND